MKTVIQKIPVKMFIGGIFSVVCLLFTVGILFCEYQIKKELYDQQIATRWSKEGTAAHISAFFTENAVEDHFYFKGIAESVKKAIQEASIDNENENARLWIDAVSKSGNISISSPRATIQVEALGISGEFFQFHPQKLLNGFLFSEDNIMQDGVVIDEEIAWQLFGSSDVVGMQVMIGQVPHFVAGVVEKPEGRLYEAAGWEKSVCYLSLDSLQKYGTLRGGYTYEIVMPNPIKGFALFTMKNILGTENENVVVLENSTRFQWLSLLEVVREFGIRSMSKNGILYPRWENVARGYEDILALLLLFKIIFLLQPCIFVVIISIYLWKKKPWTFQQIMTWIQDKWYEAGTRRVKKKEEKKKEKA